MLRTSQWVNWLKHFSQLEPTYPIKNNTLTTTCLWTNDNMLVNYLQHACELTTICLWTSRQQLYRHITCTKHHACENYFNYTWRRPRHPYNNTFAVFQCLIRMLNFNKTMLAFIYIMYIAYYISCKTIISSPFLWLHLY